MHPDNSQYGAVPPQIPYPPQAPYPPQRSKRTGGGKSCLVAIGVIVGLFVLVGACGALLSGGSAKTASSTSPSATTSAPRSSPAKAAQPTAKKAPVNGIGRQYRDGKFAFTVTKIKKGVRRVGDQYFGQTAQGQFVLVYVTVRNIGDEARTFDSSGQKLTDAQGRDFDADGAATIAMGEQSNAFLKDINPGNGVKGILIFDVPKGVKLKKLELHDSVFSGGVTVPLPG
jgi:Telomeric repeat-binding factor 2.